MLRAVAVGGGVLCVVAGGVLLATGTAPTIAVVLLVVGLLGVGFSVGGRAGSSG
ncbi:hypothetical protein [Nocardioides iriomotensis]|uniref:hypothetical protein n=1 Tax=Nocardioides iriomotensis TaxID=715784 RepID=UPI0013EC252E|nr:hypothetical protein [Nocardioides iriomotensis]